MRHSSKQSISLILILLATIAAVILLEFTTVKTQHEPIKTKPELALEKNFHKQSKHNLPLNRPLVESYQTDKAYSGFTLYSQVGTEKILLLNMAGHPVHQWNLDVGRARLLDDCSILVVHGSKWGLKRNPWKQLRPTLRRYDWSGNILWELEHGPKPFHHDVNYTSDKSIISVQPLVIPSDMAKLIENPQLVNLRIKGDRLLEFSLDGQLLWSWDFHKHTDINSCGKYKCLETEDDLKQNKKPYDWSHINSVNVVPDNKWHKAGDERFKPGNIMIMPRNWSTAMIIDKDSKQVVWQYSGSYKGGLQYAHEFQMIAPGLPGAGNILIFDNGVQRKHSIVLEINPADKKIVWVFDIGKDLYSAAAGSVQRLPNGNTLISEDITGRLLEVTKDKEIVWQYNGEGIRSARASRYPSEYCPELTSLSVD